MSVYKDGEKWRVVFRYTDWQGVARQTQKRGFKTKKEAQMWEREELLKKGSKLDMTFGSFVELYERDKKQRIKENTWSSKEPIIRLKILPYFANRKIAEIQPKDIVAWQNELLAFRYPDGKAYSSNYLKTIHGQLSAIFNHAIKYYSLPTNPAQQAGNMGYEAQREMKFWTQEEYLKFADAMMEKPRSYYAFELLYYGGIRLGEMLALSPQDFDFKRKTVTINKSYQRIKGRDVITTPKTKKSNRTIVLPDFLCDEIEDYLGMLYEVEDTERIFTMSKSYLHHEMDRGAKEAGVPRIRVHDLRHSAVSLLIEMNFTALAIADRMGHEAIDITYRYAHLFPTKQTEMANQLNIERMKQEENYGKKK